MGAGAYEVTARIARFVFLGLAAYIVFAAYRAHRAASQESARNRLNAFIGEMRVVSDVSDRLTGNVYRVPREGDLGSSRICDICLKSRSVRRRHLHFEQRTGCLLLYPKAKVTVKPQRENPDLLYDGDRLIVGGVCLQMTFYSLDDVAAPQRGRTKHEGI